jgi:hypothetical protein
MQFYSPDPPTQGGPDSPLEGLEAPAQDGAFFMTLESLVAHVLRAINHDPVSTAAHQRLPAIP